MFTEAKRTTQGMWEVICTDCGDNLGTMTGETLSRAMLFGLTRGGVKCAKCRTISCPRCFICNSGGMLCALCIWEVEAEKVRSGLAAVEP